MLCLNMPAVLGIQNTIKPNAAKCPSSSAKAASCISAPSSMKRTDANQLTSPLRPSPTSKALPTPRPAPTASGPACARRACPAATQALNRPRPLDWAQGKTISLATALCPRLSALLLSPKHRDTTIRKRTQCPISPKHQGVTIHKRTQQCPISPKHQGTTIRKRTRSRAKPMLGFGRPCQRRDSTPQGSTLIKPTPHASLPLQLPEACRRRTRQGVAPRSTFHSTACLTRLLPSRRERMRAKSHPPPSRAKISCSSLRAIAGTTSTDAA